MNHKEAISKIQLKLDVAKLTLSAKYLISLGKHNHGLSHLCNLNNEMMASYIRFSHYSQSDKSMLKQVVPMNSHHNFMNSY